MGVRLSNMTRPPQETKLPLARHQRKETLKMYVSFKYSRHETPMLFSFYLEYGVQYTLLLLLQLDATNEIFLADLGYLQ